MRHLEQSEENFHRMPTPCLILALYSHILPFHVDEIAMFLSKAKASTYTGETIPFYLLSDIAPAIFFLCLLKHQICTLLNYSPQHSVVISPNWNTTTKIYWPSSLIYHHFFSTKLLEGVVSASSSIHSSHSLLTQSNWSGFYSLH